MHILLAYSTRHFRPDSPEESGRGSASTLARALYDTLSLFGEVEYVDGLKPPKKLARKHYDLLVSILGGITPLCRRARFDKICLFAVNMHPVERNLVLNRFNAAFHVCDTHTLDKSIVSLSALDDIDRADVIFLVGNETILQSFIRHGVSPTKLHRFNYASGLPTTEALSTATAEKGAAGNRFVYAATEMCLRKGFDIVAELFRHATRRGKPFCLTIIGGNGGKTYAAKLEKLQKDLGDQVCIEGWVPSESDLYPDILKGNDFVIFPSLEEGQAGSVLDALACGLVPIVTPQTGIDFSPLGLLEPSLGSAENERILDLALDADSATTNALKQQAADYYASQHLPWRRELEDTFRLFIETGSINPQAAPTASGEAPAQYSWARRHLLAPGAWLLRFLCPSKQKRKRLYNYYRVAQRVSPRSRGGAQ